MMNFMQLFTTFLALNKQQQNDPQSQNALGNEPFQANPNIQSDMIKLPVHQDHFERFMKPETHLDAGFDVRPTQPRLFTPINNEFLKSLPHFQDHLFSNNLGNEFGTTREQNFRTGSMHDTNRRRDELRRNAGILHRFEEHVPTGAVPVQIPPTTDALFANIPPTVDIDAILAGLHVAENVPLRCDVMCDAHCPFGYLQEFCPRCQCAPDPCLLNQCFSQFETCVAVPNLNCIDENRETCPYEARCEEIGCGCPAYWQPVCGTDRDLYGKTYVNNCAMTCIRGVAKIYDGECWPSHISRYFFATTTQRPRSTRRPRPPTTVTTERTTTGTTGTSVRANVSIEVTDGATTKPVQTTPSSVVVTTESVPPVVDTSSKLLSSVKPVVKSDPTTTTVKAQAAADRARAQSVTDRARAQSVADRASTTLAVKQKQAAENMITSPMKKPRTKLSKQSFQGLELMLSRNGLTSTMTKGSRKMDFVTKTVQTLPTAATDLGGSLDAELASFDVLLNDVMQNRGKNPGIV